MKAAQLDWVDGSAININVVDAATGPRTGKSEQRGKGWSVQLAPLKQGSSWKTSVDMCVQMKMPEHGRVGGGAGYRR